MAINLDAIKAKLNSLQTAPTGGGEKTSDLWKPVAGTQVVRIVPYQHNSDFPFIELFFHYDFGGKKQMLSPSTFGKPDPIVEFSSKLQSSGKKDEWILGKKIEPKSRIYVPIIVRGLEHEGVKFWGFGKTVYQELLAFISDPDYGDITDLTSGRDITVEFKTKEQTGKDFPETSIRIKPNQTVASNDQGVINKITSQQKNILDIFKEPSYEDLKAALVNWLNTDTTSVAAETKTPTKQVAETVKQPNITETPGTSTASINTSANVKTNVADVASAFDALFK